MLYRFPRFRIFLYLPLNIVFYFIVGRLFLFVEKFGFFLFFLSLWKSFLSLLFSKNIIFVVSLEIMWISSACISYSIRGSKDISPFLYSYSFGILFSSISIPTGIKFSVFY